jgi:2-oxoglutarate dehydrogenase E2 component (dihydrolipoamide succinyltransferase)
MADIVVPTLGESVTEATVAKWFKAVGDAVAADEPLVELETDKVTVEVPAPASGVLTAIAAETGTNVAPGALLGSIQAGAGAVAKPAAAKPALAAAPAPAAKEEAALAPAVRRLVEENKLDPALIPASGKDGRLTKEDVVNYLEKKAKPAPAAAAPAPALAPAPVPAAPKAPRAADVREERVRMTRLRKRIAERLKEAQNNAAMLTTFNEVDMTALQNIRNQYKDSFEKRHGVRVGFMSFFVKACIAGLKEFPAVNAEIDGDDLVYKNYYDIGVAVGTPQGLVVPILRDADKLSFAEVEKTISELGKKARDGKLSMEDLTGGTFTISNGGVYGSLMSTPILNPPQSGILGMHKIQDRPMAVNGQVVIRPMMYLALSYDHRIIDGREAVSFLVRVKECIEDPQRILLDL